ncbi:PPOX class F420-dependent oxidoreductase [Pseudonocardia phyllosphaerae]|uniref:PPOX class F420-dependent oxidoreductase n=1 Tax=Pseudonocardia phyllosphaerae TaxID=3390502 RepID=UPI00397A6793
MSVYTDSELEFLQVKGRLGRLGTIGPDGGPQLRPVSFRVDPATGAIDVPGRRNPDTQKWRNAGRRPQVSFVVDDTGDGPGWSPRVVEVRGVAELLPDEHPADLFPGVGPGVIRIHPRRILSHVDGTENNRSVPSAGQPLRA